MAKLPHAYEFQGYGGVDQCELCDEFAPVNDYTRSDGKASMVCHRCRMFFKL